MISRTHWRVGAIVAVLVAAVMVLATSGAHGMPAAGAAAAGVVTYTDPAGDVTASPDVTTVTITGDPATSRMTMSVTVPNYLPATPDAFERYVQVWIDMDSNISTGDPQDGTEWGLVAWNDSTGRWWTVERWNGSEWVTATRSPTMDFTRTGDVLSWTVSASDLGGAKAFRFYIHACTWDPVGEEHLAVDEAPDRGWWTYSLEGTNPTPPPPAEPIVKLVISTPRAEPARAVAGKRFTVTFPVSFSVKKRVTTIDISTGEETEGWILMFTPVPRGKMDCAPTVGGKTIVHRESLAAGKARLSLVVPKAAKGKLLTVRVKITATEKQTGETVTGSKVATFRVR